MKSLVALVLLAQLLSCKAGLVPDIPPEVLPHKHLACDDPETEAAAAVAVNYINNRLKHGYKLALNRIEKVVEHERPQVTEGEQPGKRKGGHRDGGESHEGDGDSKSEIGAEQLDGIPVPPESQQPKPNPSLPDIHGAPEGSRPLGKPGLTKPAKPLSPPPFPAGFSDSDTCPGEILVFIYGLEPLLPKRPVEVSPTGAAEFQEKVKH